MSEQSPEERIVLTTAAMLNGQLPYLQGALYLVQLRTEVGAYENDPDFFAFVGIATALLHQPFSIEDENWLELASRDYPMALREAESFAREQSLLQCQSLWQRYSAMP